MDAADATTDAPGLTRVVVAAWPLLTSVLLLMSGSGLQSALLGVRADASGFNSNLIGLMLGLYYIGYVGGSAWVPGLIRSVGHIRVFAALASMASATVVVHGIWVSPIPWILLRLITGVCIAGLFVVSESWLNELASSHTRARLLAIYNTVVTAGLMIGTLLLNAAAISGVVLFVIGSVMLSMAAVPIALAPHEAPVPEASMPVSWSQVFRAAPLGLTGAATSGLTVGAIFGFGAIYATRAGFGVGGASQFLVAILVGAIAGQVPLGNWSDRTDRRIVLGAASALVLAGAAVGVVATMADSFPGAIFAAVLIGAGGVSMYALSLAHQADYTDPVHMLSAGSALLTVNGLAAAVGPVAAAIAIGVIGPEGMFHVLGAAVSLFGLFVLARRFMRAPAAEYRRSRYTPLATGTTVAGLEDVVSETTGVEHDELRRRWRRRQRLLRLRNRVR